MSSTVTAKCPKCGHQVTVEEEESQEPVACASCQASFVPAKVIEESNERFQFWMYVGMVVIALGLVAYMAITNRMKPKPDAQQPPPAAKADADKTDAAPADAAKE